MIGSLLLKLLPSFLFHDYLTRQKLVDAFFLRFSRDRALSLRRVCYICYLFLLKVNLHPWKALGLGENGTFNSEDTVQLPMLINYFKPLSLVAEQCLLSGNICQSPQRATGARLLHVDSPLIPRHLLRYFLCISFSWNEDSLTQLKGNTFYAVWSLIIGVSILYVLKPACGLVTTQKAPLQQQ